MAEIGADQLFELETRKLELEELREKNRRSEAIDAQSLEKAERDRIESAEEAEHKNRRRTLVVSIVTALVTASGTLGVAAITGLLSVSETVEANRGAQSLEQQRFALKLLDEALKIEDLRQRANQLLFMTDIGLFDEQLNSRRIRELAEIELARVERGEEGESLLPNSLTGEAAPVAFFFEGEGANLELFRTPRTVEVLRRYGLLDNPEAIAMILANLHFESGGFRLLEENINYSALRLMQIFPSVFATEVEAQRYARQPEKAANRIYANSLGNRDEASGDGWRFRGRGFLMISGRAAYERLGKQLDIDLEGNPDLAADPVISLDLALTIISTRSGHSKTGIEWALSGDDERLRRIINGGTYGLKKAIELKDAYLAAFAAEAAKEHPIVIALNAASK